ncbi:hypothetical protein PMKS-002013 [Pichia membranifaciens]|uniref:Uncharacterized protein n=1 Tax=Pichia membranifaciens TaxID=4926 RepID=A0A1Q2YG69_9ASCO|nr:hypothetical protein PMKS-002013 [Pichia membranifaciens]
MSRRNEIRQKEQLQLQLQAQFNKLDQTVLSWLSKTTGESKPETLPSTKSASTEKTEDTNSQRDVTQQFINQLVIPSGKGINFSDLEPSNNSSKGSAMVTINDFLDTVSAKNPANGRRETNGRGRISDKINKVGDVKRRTGSSNSLRALSNKLRDDRREKFRGNTRKIGPNNKYDLKKNSSEATNKSKTKQSGSESDSENDDEILYRKSKSSGMSAKIAKNKRPF